MATLDSYHVDIISGVYEFVLITSEDELISFFCVVIVYFL